MILTRATILEVNLTGDINTVTCRACGEQITYNIKDNFTPIHVWEKKGGKEYTRTIKTNKQLIKQFLELHFGKHMRGE